MKNKMNFRMKKKLLVAVVVALCLCVSVAAVSQQGQFRDKTNLIGTVTGTEYVQATNEIAIDAVGEFGTLTVTATLLVPDSVPYSTLDTVRLGSYRIESLSGGAVIEGKDSAPAEIVDGTVTLAVSVDDLDRGDYKLVITSFVGEKKADQPLAISGEWECGFTI